MAKKKRKSRSATPMSVASPRLLQISPIVQKALRSSTLKILSDRLRKIEDRRHWSPHGPLRSARSFNAAHHQLVVKKSGTKSRSVPTGIKFRASKKVLVCVRRGARREVLFAKNRTGKGSRARRARGWFSAVSC